MSWGETIARIIGSEVRSSRKLAGGDLGGATMLELADGRRLVAKQHALAKVEGGMLSAIRASGAPAPQVLHAEGELLLMEWIEGGGRPGWESLAQGLALLHAPQDQTYGWEADYRFGPVAIANARSGNWAAFWGEHRIACHARFLGPVTAQRLEALAARMGEILPTSPPSSLLHGDLWGGNVLYAEDRLSGLIDPACYYGHREVDVAMLTLFDHPPEEFFAALSLEEGWRERLPAYRLWPLLVHLRLFGESYRAPVERALDLLGA